MRAPNQILDPVMKVLQGLRDRKSGQEPEQAPSVPQVLENVTLSFRRGDYEAAAQAAEGFKLAGAESEYCFHRGSMLMYLGRFPEAEPLLRRSVLLHADPHRSALAYSMLGQNLQEQSRYDEGMDCLEAALRRWPANGSIHRRMAELQLHRGDCPTEALKWANLAVEEERAAVGSSEAQKSEELNLNLALALTVFAWAAAVATRNRAKVDALVAEALPLVDAGCVPALAQANYQCGQAYLALGDPVRSRELFAEVARIDPQGIWGRSAAAKASAPCQ